MAKRTRILAYDATPTKLWDVSTFWVIGAVLFFWKFKRIVRAKSWDDVLKACAEYDDVELHFWGHGAPGTSLIGTEELPEEDARWTHVALLWLRTCSALAGVSGVGLANEIAKHGTAVAGHLVIIGTPWHSYLVGCNHDQPPWWPVNHPDPSIWSARGMPRSVFPLRMSLPAWWNKTEPRINKEPAS